MTAYGYTGGDPSKVSTTGYTKGNVLAADGTGTLQPLPVGVDGQFLEALSTAPDGVTWAAGGGGGGSLSNTVVSETSYDQAATAGIAATSSRGDHTHGTPSVRPLYMPNIASPAPPVTGLSFYSYSNNGYSVPRIMTPEGDEIQVLRDTLYVARNVGAPITKGQLVYISDVFPGTGVVPVVSLAQANAIATVAQAVAMDPLATNGFGRVMVQGRLVNVNTVAWPANTILYTSETTPGALTSTRPSPPNLSQPVGYVIRSHASLGLIQMDITDPDGWDPGTNQNSFQIGDGTAGTKSVVFFNGQRTTLGAAPTATRTISFPDQSGTIGLNQPIFPPVGYGLIAMSGNPESFMGVSALANNNPFFVRVYVPPGKPITGVYVAVRDAGTYDGVTTGNTINVYDDAAATTLLGTIGETPTLWAANGWRGGNIVGGPLAASASERFIYVGAIAKGMTVAPNVTYMTSAQDAQAPWFDFGVAQTHKRGMYVNATALPATFDPTTYGTSTTFLLMVGIA